MKGIALVGDATVDGGTIANGAQSKLFVSGVLAVVLGGTVTYSFYPFTDTFTSNGSTKLYVSGVQAVLALQTMTAIISDQDEVGSTKLFVSQ